MKSYTYTAMPKISYFVLPDCNLTDVYLRKELPSEVDSEGEDVFVYDEVNFRISSDITQQQIEENFELLFNNPNALDERELPLEEKIKMLEDENRELNERVMFTESALLDLILMQTDLIGGDI